jgi:hypothetical protein
MERAARCILCSWYMRRRGGRQAEIMRRRRVPSTNTHTPSERTSASIWVSWCGCIALCTGRARDSNGKSTSLERHYFIINFCSISSRTRIQLYFHLCSGPPARPRAPFASTCAAQNVWYANNASSLQFICECVAHFPAVFTAVGACSGMHQHLRKFYDRRRLIRQQKHLSLLLIAYVCVRLCNFS